MGLETEMLVFAKNRKAIPVQLTLENGSSQKYTLKEFSGADRSTFLDLVMSKSQVEDGKVMPKSGNVGMLQSRLIHLCMFDDKGKQVPEKDILELPSSTIDGLFKACQQLNGLDEAAQDDAKND